VTKPFNRLVDQVPPSGIRRFFDLVVGAQDVISLGVGEPDFMTPWAIREDAIYSLEHGRVTYTENGGLLACRQAVSTYLSDFFHAHYDPHTQIVMTIGVSEGVDLVLRSLLNPGNEVIIPEPAYVCYGPLVQLAGGRPVPINTQSSGFIPTVAAIEAAITPATTAIILCSPSNPTGRSIPKERQAALLDLAKRHDLWVISDEVYAALSYDTPPVSMGSFSSYQDRVIVLNGFSKAFSMTGWRLGYVCGPPELIKRVIKIHQYCALCAPTVSQYAAIEGLKHAHKEVEKMRVSYLKRRNLVVHALQDMGLPTLVPEGAFYVFPSIEPTGLDAETFALQLLEKEKVAVVPGTAFGLGGDGHIRCCYATDMSQLTEAMARMARFVKGVMS